MICLVIHNKFQLFTTRVNYPSLIFVYSLEMEYSKNLSQDLSFQNSGAKTSLLSKLRAPFPYYLEDDRKNMALVTGISLFVIVFLLIYRPFGQHLPELTFPQVLVFSAITFLVLSINIIGFPKWFPEVFEPTRWNLGKYFLFTVWHCFLIGIASTVVDVYFVCPQNTFLENLIHANTQVALTGIIPITVMTLFLKNRVLMENLQSAILTNRELEKISRLKKKTEAPQPEAFTIYSDTSESLRLHLKDLLFVAANDNYSTVVWKENSQIEKKLLRINLKNLETQLDNAFALRCHRSYLVNIHAIESLTGNTNGYKIRLRDYEETIPVSRQKGKELMTKIKQLKSLMELG